MESAFKKIPPGGCPYCYSDSVHVIESEMDELILTGKGEISSFIPISFRCTGFCMKCGKRIFVDPTGKYYQTFPYDEESIRIYMLMNKLDKERIDKLPKATYIDENENPFIQQSTE